MNKTIFFLSLVSKIYAQNLTQTGDSDNGDQSYNITDDIGQVDSSKVPEIILLVSVVGGIIIVGLILYCCVCRSGKSNVPEADEVDVTEKFDIENV